MPKILKSQKKATTERKEQQAIIQLCVELGVKHRYTRSDEWREEEIH